MLGSGVQEYGLPSSHTMHSLCLNFYIAHYYVSMGVIPVHWALPVYLVAALWVAWIGFSRVYMGMHTPIDIGGGALIAVMVLSTYLAVDGEPASHARLTQSTVLLQHSGSSTQLPVLACREGRGVDVLRPPRFRQAGGRRPCESHLCKRAAR